MKGHNLLLFFIFTLSAQAAIIQSNPPLVVNAADRQQVEGDKFIAAGNVEISWDEYKLYTDYLEFNLETKELLAKGRVTMTSQKTVISGEQFRFNLKDKTGELVETYGQLSPTTRYTTDRLEVKDKETLAFNKLDFTPCAQCVPRWKITCSKGKIKKEKYIEMKNIFFKVKNIPVFYLPYLRYPLPKNGRATGFLFPLMGTSPRQGLYIKNAFFWDIEPNLDLTLGIDYFSKVGLGTADEFRYLFDKTAGNISFYLFKYRDSFRQLAEDTTGNAEKTASEWKPGNETDFFLKMKHVQDISFLKTRLTIDINKESDPNFVRFFSDDFNNQQNLTYRSAVSINTSVSRLKLAASVSDNEAFMPADNKSSITRYLPSVELNVNQQKLGLLPWYFSLAISYTTRITREKVYGAPVETAAKEATKNPFLGVPLSLLTVKPSFTLPLLKAPWASANLTLKSNHGFYPRSRDPEVKELVILDEPVLMDYQTADLTVKGPVFSRIFELKGCKIKHIIEPQITFKYATDPDEEDRKRLLQKDSFYFQESSTLGLALTMRLLYKSRQEKSSARELFSYMIKQEYYLDPVLANRNRTVDGIYPEFSQLSNTLRFRPLKDFILDATVNYNHYIKNFSQILVTMEYQNSNSILGGSFRYTKTYNQYLYDTTTSTGETESEENTVPMTPLEKALLGETIGAGLNFNKPNFPIRLSGRLDYNLKTGEFAYSNLVLSCDYQCINFYFKVSTFKVDKELDVRFRFGFSLGNLGMVRDFFGGS